MAGSIGLLFIFLLSLAHLGLAYWPPYEDGWHYKRPKVPGNKKLPWKDHGGPYHYNKPPSPKSSPYYKPPSPEPSPPPSHMAEPSPPYTKPPPYTQPPTPYKAPPYTKNPPPHKPPPYTKNAPQKSPPPYKPPQKSPPPYKPPHKPPPPYKTPQKSPPPYKPTPPKANNSWAKQWLDPHNAARAELGLPPMVWNETVAKYAEWWADQRKLHGNCQMQHSNGPYGENLFWGIGYPFGPSDCVEAWVSEKDYYHYSDNSCDPGQMCGHYTQIIWKMSLHLGCARVQCESGDILMTCNYDPPGNWIGYKPY